MTALDTTALTNEQVDAIEPIEATRIVAGLRGEVFAAWTHPERLATWFGPREDGVDFKTPHVNVDVRPGGAYRICIRSLKGVDYWMSGTYERVEAPHRLVFTHQWDSDSGEPARIEVSFDDAADGSTRVSFRKSGFATAASRDSEIEGWHECLDRLVRTFATKTRSSQAADDEREIRALFAAWSRALEAKDANGLVNDLAPDAVLYDLLPPYKVVGRDAIRAVWERCLPYFPAKFQSVHRDLVLTVSGDLAVVHGLHQMVVPDQPDHPAGQSWLRLTACFRRIDGRWRGVHDHVSMPIDCIKNQPALITDADLAAARA